MKYLWTCHFYELVFAIAHPNKILTSTGESVFPASLLLNLKSDIQYYIRRRECAVSAPLIMCFIFNVIIFSVCAFTLPDYFAA